MKNAIKLSLFLGIVSAISTIALAAVNEFTAPIIAQYAQERFNATLQGLEAFQELANFDTRVIAGEEETEQFIMQVIEAWDGDERIGFIYSKVVPGNGGPITYFMVIDNDGNFIDFEAVSHSETPGIGARVFDTPDWRNRLLSKHVDDHVDVLVGASITSRALIGGIGSMRADFNANRN